MHALVLSSALVAAPAMLGQNNREQQAPEPAPTAQQPQAQPSPEKAASESFAPARQVDQNPGKADESARTRGEAGKAVNSAGAEERLSSEAMASFQSQMRELQDQADQFGARARATQDALRSIKDQMAEQGLDLRLDVREAESRMNYLLSKAHEDILHGDAFGAEADLKMAAYAADFIERFLGR